ncbi:helix-turn-helix domain-containing protein [Altibacter sp. HG106]|uniref:helix-turn-helix domain-containing protein n=1 Tax=Altibacter sp. HG106 TaxID=3023937 RepID=UPI00234FD1BA|nr:helix-turn-helix transcriptional regulator [Altibacter sp. HG106]MDC7993863.1 helix-turn-helix transcriptional regulator [Altibacter sp. HG106]
MTKKTNINWAILSDQAILSRLGEYLKQERLFQNKSQEAIAEAAGINRWTLGKIENGDGITLTSFIQILRALDRLERLEVFVKQPVISPLQLAKLEQQQRKRASDTSEKNKNAQPDW